MEQPATIFLMTKNHGHKLKAFAVTFVLVVNWLNQKTKTQTKFYMMLL